MAAIFLHSISLHHIHCPKMSRCQKEHQGTLVPNSYCHSCIY